MATVMMVSSPLDFFNGDFNKVELFNETFSDFYENFKHERKNFYILDLPTSETLMINSMLYKMDKDLHSYFFSDLYLPGDFPNFNALDVVYGGEEEIRITSTNKYRTCILKARELLKHFKFKDNLYMYENNGVEIDEVLDFDSTIDFILEGIDTSEKNNVPIFFSF